MEPHRPAGEKRRAKWRHLRKGGWGAIAASVVGTSREERPKPKPSSCSWRLWIIATNRRYIPSLHCNFSEEWWNPRPFSLSPPIHTFSWWKWSENILYLQICIFRKIIYAWKQHNLIKTYSWSTWVAQVKHLTLDCSSGCDHAEHSGESLPLSLLPLIPNNQANPKMTCGVVVKMVTF